MLRPVAALRRWNCTAALLGLWAAAAPLQAQPAPADSVVFEPGLAARRQRYERPTYQKVAMVPVHVLRFPFRILNYPLERSIHRDPGPVSVYGNRTLASLRRNGITFQSNADIGPGSGYGGGLVYHFPRQWTGQKPVRLAGALTLTGYEQVSLSIDSLHVGPIGYGMRVQYTERPRENFNGFGPGSDLDNATSYQLDEWQAMWRGWLPLTRSFRVTATLGVSRSDIGRGRDPELPSALEVFPASIEGLQGRYEFLETGMTAIWDTRDVPTYPRSGHWIGALVGLADGIGGSREAYAKLSLDAQQFIPLWGERRSLVIRVRGAITENRSDVDSLDVPVFRQERMGGVRTLRGYESNRFIDKDSALFNFEYRFPIWYIGAPDGQALDGALLFDCATTVPDISKLQQRDFRSGAGIAFRFANQRGLIGRLENAWSPEGFQITFGLSRVF